MLTPDFFLNLVHTFGYAGVFLSSLIGSASVILPVPSFAFVFAAGSLLNPLAVGILAGVGAAIGELTGYGIGFGIRYGISKRKKDRKGIAKNRWFIRARKWSSKKSMFLLVFIFAATPLPDDIIGIICGSIKYDIKKFFIATLIGKIILSLVLAYAGFYGVEWLKGFFV